ncbi:hypothetical protein CYMTET_19181 [Cymbomonas tetramitiformis]|uniref:Fatty acid desaturase domain-containing protein n=1 Tax=Cymbomonas tetramitiformis TaxID=36881 RepID=A0AAE0L5H5_9CHLO|nr:hypothetical protein CYMTET_19181 [Cymbomonas tetramitiformis]
MWDRRGHQFCVLSEKTKAHWELMESLVRHTEGDSERMAPMGSVTDLTCKVEKFYPVTDGEGGCGEVFDTNAAAQEFLHLGEGRIMLSACRSESDARDELGSYGARRAPPARPHKTVTRDGEGPSGHALRPAAAPSSSTAADTIHQTWPNGKFGPGSREYQPHVFQGTYEAESDTNSVDTTQESVWLDRAQIAELSQKGGKTVFLVRYQYLRGKVILMLGKPNAERGKVMHTCELSSKQMHRYSYSAAQGQRGEYIPLGGQSAGCSGGLVGTVQQHLEDVIGGEELADLARRHLSEGPQQGTLHVLRTRATPRAKPVYYVCEAHAFYHKHASYGIVFKPEYMASMTRKFDMCSWVTWDKASVVHKKAPLSALTIRVEPALRTEVLRAQLARTFVGELAAAEETDPAEPTLEMLNSDSRDARETRHARCAVNDVVHDVNYGAREQRFVDEAIASDMFNGGRESQATRSGLHSRGILEANLHQRPEYRPVISLALPTASEDNFSDTTQAFQSIGHDQEAASHRSPQVQVERVPTEHHRPLREDVQATGSFIQDGPYLEPGQATWGPDAPEFVVEWRKNLDLEGWGNEMRALERELKAEQGESDVSHLNGVLFWSNVCYFSGLALAGVCNPLSGNPISALLISTAIFARWTMVGHHVSHGGYTGQARTESGGNEWFHRAKFAKGLQRRALDWLDWMLPEAWDVEHNNLHHYQLGEGGDPDLVEKNLKMIREQPIPVWARYLRVAVLMPVWKWYYYAPNTLKEMSAAHVKRAETNPKYAGATQPFKTSEPATFALALRAMVMEGNVEPMAATLRVLLPYFAFHFVLCPLPFYLIGGSSIGNIALANFVLAELITNVHSFIVIVTNHCGKDVYRFDTQCAPRSNEFYLRAVIGSVNYRTAHTTPGRPEDKPAGMLGNVNDFMHGWLNYQIEHHMFPELSMLSYQKAMPRVKEACERYGVPYVQQSVWTRLKRTLEIMVGTENMLQWERGM